MRNDKAIISLFISFIFSFLSITGNCQNNCNENRIDSLIRVCSLYVSLNEDLGTRETFQSTADNITELLSLIRQCRKQDDSTYYYWLIKRADSYYEGDQLSRAVTDYQAALTAPQSDSLKCEILYRLARCYYIQNQRQSMLDCIEQWEGIINNLITLDDERAVWYLSKEIHLYQAIDLEADKASNLFAKRDSIMKKHPEMAFDRMICYLEDYYPDEKVPEDLIEEMKTLSNEISVGNDVHCLANIFLILSLFFNSNYDFPSHIPEYIFSSSVEYLEDANNAYKSYLSSHPYHIEEDDKLQVNFYQNVQTCYRFLLQAASGVANKACDNKYYHLSDSVIDRYILTHVSASRLSSSSDLNEYISLSDQEYMTETIRYTAYQAKCLNMFYGQYGSEEQIVSVLDSMNTTVSPDYNRILYLLPKMMSKDRQRYMDEYREIIQRATEIPGYANGFGINEQKYLRNAFDVTSFFKGILIDYDTFGRQPDSKVFIDDIAPILNNSILVYFVDHGDLFSELAYDSLTGTYSSRVIWDASSFDSIWSPSYYGRTVFFVPDGRLTYLNIEHLVNQNGVAAHQLIDLHRITSVRELVLTHESPKHPFEMCSAVLFGGITYDNLKFLPGSEKEVLTIKSILGKDNCILYSKKDATKNAFFNLSKTNPGIIHIASHAFSIPGERYGISLSGSEFVSEYEISKMDLRGTELVVLSACDTAGGQVSWEGATGLQRAFKLAGVKTIIMALGKVNDTASQFFMSQFYDALSKIGDKREAYNKAITATRKEFNDDDYYWAPFIMLD